jgi:hypothetical protein
MSQEDRAQEEEAAEWARRNMDKPGVPQFKPGDDGYGPEFCSNEDCGEEMPLQRRVDGRRHCTDCQGVIERRQRRGY